MATLESKTKAHQRTKRVPLEKGLGYLFVREREKKNRQTTKNKTKKKSSRPKTPVVVISSSHNCLHTTPQRVMGLCASKPTVGRSKYAKSKSAVVRDARSGKLTRVNGGSLKALGNALFFPVRFRSI